MSLAPVVMFVYNRADHFEKTFEALNRCPEAIESVLYVFSDGPKNEKSKEQVEAVRKALKTAKNVSRFKKLEIIESPTNKGLAASVITGVTKIINEYGKVIVIEDDCETSPYFLSYMNQCLEFYKDDLKVGSIAGFTPQFTYPEDFKDDIFFAYRSCSCGWGSWARCWKDIDWELQHIKDFYDNPKLVQRLNSNGQDRFIRLYRQTKGNGSSWSVRFGAHLVKQELLTLYPRYSYIQNIGCDASGVHSQEEDAEKMRVDLNRANPNPKLKNVTVRDDLQKMMKKHYSAGWYSDIKRSLATKLIIAKERRNL